MRRCYAVGVGAALVVAACSIGRPMPSATTYSIEPALAQPSAAESPRGERLQVERVRVAAPYDRAALVYRLSAVRYVSDPYHAFLAEPGPMLGTRIADWLAAAGPFKSVAAPGSGVPASLALEVTITELYGDFEKASDQAAVMSMQFTVIDKTSARAKVAYERSITRRIPLTNQSAEGLVQGYDTALAEILSQLAHDLATYVAQRQ